MQPFVQSSKREDLTRFAAGAILFKKGDPGGDLYLIHSGFVEISVEHDGNKVVLTKMGPGEIIGIPTCMTKAPRFATAYAVTEVELQLISQEKLSKIFKTLPPWMFTIVKDLVNRLDSLNGLYSESHTKIREMHQFLPTRLEMALRLAKELINAVELFEAGSEAIVLGDLLDKASRSLNCEVDELERIVKVFYLTGIVPSTTVGHVRQAKLRAFKDLKGFIHYAQRRLRHPIVPPTRHLTNTELTTLTAIVEFSRRRVFVADAKASLPLASLLHMLVPNDSTQSERALIELARDLDILILSGPDEGEFVEFTPDQLAKAVAYERALRHFQEPAEEPHASLPLKTAL